MIKIAICDNSLTDAGNVESCLLQSSMKVECEVYVSGEELIHTLEMTKQKYDMYVLDIEMDGMTGIELAEKIREQDIGCLIVFLTSYPQYMHKSFQVVVFDYILKPIDIDKAEELLGRARKYLLPTNALFNYTFNKQECSVRSSDIFFLQREKRKMVLHLTDGSHKWAYMSMDDVLKQLDDEEFFRINYSTIINLRYIDNMKGQEITISNKMTFICNRDRLQELKQKHLHYINRR